MTAPCRCGGTERIQKLSASICADCRVAVSGGPLPRSGPVEGREVVAQGPTCCTDAREADPKEEWTWHDH